MATTIPGGATRDAAGTWRDANGRELSKKQIADAQKAAAERSPDAAPVLAPLVTPDPDEVV